MFIKSRVLLAVAAGIGAAFCAPQHASAQFVCEPGGGTASGAGSVACGPNSTASGQESSAYGERSTASGNFSAAYGSLSTASAQSSSAFGRQSNASAPGSSAYGAGSNASGERSSAHGFFATARGKSSSAFGENSEANETRSTALGAFAKAEHENSTAIGAGAATTRDGQVAVGHSGNTYTMAGLTSDASKTAQGAPTKLVTTNEAGDLAAHTAGELGLASLADLSGLQSQINGLAQRDRELADGIAMSLALAQPIFMPGQSFALRVGYGNFDGSSAVGVSAAGVVARGHAGPTSSVVLDAGIGFAPDTNMAAGRAGITFGW